MGIRRAMVCLENVDGKPENRFVNTFHFGPTDTTAAIVTALTNFYNQGAGGGIAQFLSSNISRVTDKCRIKIYDLADPTPRAPISDDPLNLSAPTSSVNLPNELAVCLSFYALRSLPRQRGRIYMGPFQTSVIEQVSGTAPDELVSGTLIGYMTGAAITLKDDANTTWSIWSPTDATARAVTAGWVDKSWDIQRRRGALPSTRFPF